jgi:hypothetical protein
MSAYIKSEPREARAKVRYISAPVVLALGLIRDLFVSAGYEMVITSVNDGHHGESSKHYEGDAVDLRTWHMTPHWRDWVYREAKKRLGPDYDVVIESTPRDNNDRWAEHMHIEHDPKRD